MHYSPAWKKEPRAGGRAAQSRGRQAPSARVRVSGSGSVGRALCGTAPRCPGRAPCPQQTAPAGAGQGQTWVTDAGGAEREGEGGARGRARHVGVAAAQRSSVPFPFTDAPAIPRDGAKGRAGWWLPRGGRGRGGGPHDACAPRTRPGGVPESRAHSRGAPRAGEHPQTG